MPCQTCATLTSCHNLHGSIRSSRLVGQLRTTQPAAQRHPRVSLAAAARRSVRVQVQQQQQQAAAAADTAAAAAGEQSDSEDKVPPGCARYTVKLPKPLGLVLEEGKSGRGVYVAEVVPEGNAALLAPEISVGDELVATSGLTYTTEQVYQENVVRGGETYVRLNVRNNSFKTVMAAIGSHPAGRKVVLDFQRCD